MHKNRQRIFSLILGIGAGEFYERWIILHHLNNSWRTEELKAYHFRTGRTTFKELFIWLSLMVKRLFVEQEKLVQFH